MVGRTMLVLVFAFAAATLTYMGALSFKRTLLIASRMSTGSYEVSERVLSLNDYQLSFSLKKGFWAEWFRSRGLSEFLELLLQSLYHLCICSGGSLWSYWKGRCGKVEWGSLGGRVLSFVSSRLSCL